MCHYDHVFVVLSLACLQYSLVTVFKWSSEPGRLKGVVSKFVLQLSLGEMDFFNIYIWTKNILFFPLNFVSPTFRRTLLVYCGFCRLLYYIVSSGYLVNTGKGEYINEEKNQFHQKWKVTRFPAWPLRKHLFLGFVDLGQVLSEKQ